MLKIECTSNGEAVLTLSGRLQADSLGELAAALDALPLGTPVTLDLTDVVLADEDGVRFLCACERDGIALHDCPPYIRTWMAHQRNRS